MTRDEIVRGLRNLADEWGEEGLLGDMTAMEFVTAAADLLEADKALAGEPGEAEGRVHALEAQVRELREGFIIAQRRAWKEGVIAHRRGLRLSDGELTTEAARLYPEKPQEGKEEA